MGFTLDDLPNTILLGISVSSLCLFIHLEKFEKFPPCRKQGNKHTREDTVSNQVWDVGHRKWQGDISKGVQQNPSAKREREMRRNNMRKFDLQEFTFGLLLIGQRERFRLQETGPR